MLSCWYWLAVSGVLLSLRSAAAYPPASRSVRIGAGQAAALQRCDDGVLHRQAEGGEIRGVLQLGGDADAGCGGDVEDLVEGQDRLLTVEGGVGGAEVGQAFVLGEPAGDGLAVDGLRRPAAGEFGVGGDVGGAADLVLVADDQDAVAAHDQIGLDIVGALFDGPFIGQAGVLGPFARGAAVGDDQGVGQRGTRGQEGDGQQDEPDHAPGIGAGGDAGMTIAVGVAYAPRIQPSSCSTFAIRASLAPLGGAKAAESVPASSRAAKCSAVTRTWAWSLNSPSFGLASNIEG